MAVVGIDFGSQACYVCVARQGGVETIDNEYSDRRTPTVVAYGTDRRFMGVSAKNQMVTNPKNTITGFRNLLGRGFSDPITQDEIRNVPFTVEERKDKTVGYRISHLGNEEVLSPQQITVAMLSHLKAIAETALKTKVTDCVISVPAYFTDGQRRALLDSCQAVQLNCLRLINDTTAAALAYGIYKQDLPEEKEKSRNVVFVDLGYTGLQVAVCAFNKGKLKVLAKSFELGVGGRYFDECLVNHFAEEFKKKYKIDSLAKPRHRLRLKNECEKLKKLLSANATKIPINIESFVDDKDVTGHMNREEFQQLCSGLIEKIQMTLSDVLGKAKLTVEDIHSVEIIGGSCRIPAVKEIITNIFKKPPSTMLNMDEGVARGCALQCAILSPTFRVRDFNITDIQPFPIKLLWESKFTEEIAGEDREHLPSSDMMVFKEGDHIGVSKMLTFYRKEPFFLQAEYSDPLAVPCENHVIGRFSVKNVVPAATGEPSKLKVKVRVNTHGIFGVMNAFIVEKTIVEEPPQPPPPAEDKAAGEAAASAAPTAPTDTKEQPEKQEETKSMENDAEKQNGDAKPKEEEAKTNNGTEEQKTPPDVQMKSEYESQESDSTGQEIPVESMETDSANQQQTQSDDTTDGSAKKPATKKPTDTTDKPEEPAKETPAENGKEKETPSEPKKPKKQVKHIDLPVESVTFSLSKADLNAVMEKEGEMHAQDKKQIERANARNAVEEYVYDMKDKLETVYKEFVAEQDREKFYKLLSDTEDWLYEEGEDESKSVYNKKLEELKKHGDPIVKRVKEFEGRSAAVDQLGSVVVRYVKKLTQYKEGNEELAHIPAEEMLKVEEAVQKKQQWMNEQLQKLNNLPKSADPPVTIAQITAEAKLLSTTCDPIVNKPKPKVEPPKEEAKKDKTKKEDEKDGKSTDQQQEATEQQDTTQNTSAGEPQPTGDNAGTENTSNSAPNDAMDVD